MVLVYYEDLAPFHFWLLVLPSVTTLSVDSGVSKENTD